jgi:hypothetical protein
MERKRSIFASLSDSLPRPARARLSFSPYARRNRDGRPPLPPGVHSPRVLEFPRFGVERHSSQPVVNIRNTQWDVIRGGK